ncbi:MAG TPA: hypothetical protein VMG10_13005 [Gemmataceae bacterium]|nr:hypothetical protein [Gemmataceae bacterium]
MTPTDFLQLLDSILRQRRVAFSRAAAIVFVESCWELIDDNPDGWFWADRFVEAAAVEMMA